MGETLCRPRRCCMFSFERLDKHESLAEAIRQALRVVTGHGETAACFGAVGGERGDHHVSAGDNGRACRTDIGLLMGGFDQEMEDRSVVPRVDGFGEAEVAYVCDDVLDARRVGNGRPKGLERGGGDVDGDDLESRRGQLSDQWRLSCADHSDSA